MRILLCDDHAVFAESLAMVLKGAGHAVTGVACSPAEALPMLREARPDVCLMDFCFPDTTALEHLPELRAVAPDTRFVLLSGFIDSEIREAGYAAGVYAFAHKGQQASEILGILARLPEPGHTGPHAVRLPGGEAWRGDGRPTRPGNDAQRFARFLTPREREVLIRLVRGESTSVLAREMGITRSTARCHVQSVLVKLGVHSQREAVVAATRDGLVSVTTGEWLLS